MNNVLMIITIFLFSSCLYENPADINNDQNVMLEDSRFSNIQEKITIERAMKDLPNFINFKKSFFLVLVGKYNETELKGVKISVKEVPTNRIIYSGQGLGIYHLPKSRIKIPIRGSVKEVQTQILYPNGDIEKKNYLIDKREVVLIKVDKA